MRTSPIVRRVSRSLKRRTDDQIRGPAVLERGRSYLDEAWTLSGALMGMGGGLWAQYNIAFGPRQFFFAITFSLLAMLVVGGLGSVSGAVIGAFVVTAVFEIMRRIEDRIDVPGITQIVVAHVILLVLYRRPNGLMGLSEADDVLARRFSRLRR